MYLVIDICTEFNCCVLIYLLIRFIYSQIIHKLGHYLVWIINPKTFERGRERESEKAREIC